MQNYQNNRVISNMNMNVNTNNISNSNNNVNATSLANIDPSNSNTILTNSQTNNQNSNQNNPVTQSRCGFSESSVFPDNYMYGQSYVPIQYIDSTFRPEVGLKMGTIFPELVSPYEPGQNMREMQFLASRPINP